MDKQIIEGLNIFAKYTVDGSRIEIDNHDDGSNDILIHYTAFNESEVKKLKTLGWDRYKDKRNDYYYHII